MELYKIDGTLLLKTEHSTVVETVEYCATKKISLSGVKIFAANLYGGDFRHIDLSYANLSYANIYGANLHGANLSYANLFEVDLSGSKLKWANLTGANLRGANLDSVELFEAIGIYTFNKKNGRTCYAVQHEKCLMIQAGCFWGSLDEFEAQCKEQYPQNPIEAYAPQISYLRELEKTLYT